MLIIAVGGMCLLGRVPRIVAQDPAAAKTTEEDAKHTAGTGASDADIKRWIAELSHDAYTVRQEAASQLLAAGMAARAPLMELRFRPRS